MEIHIPVPSDVDSPSFKTSIGTVRYIPDQAANAVVSTESTADCIIEMSNALLLHFLNSCSESFHTSRSCFGHLDAPPSAAGLHRLEHQTVSGPKAQIQCLDSEIAFGLLVLFFCDLRCGISLDFMLLRSKRLHHDGKLWASLCWCREQRCLHEGA